MWWEKSNNDSRFENENILFTESRRINKHRNINSLALYVKLHPIKKSFTYAFNLFPEKNISYKMIKKLLTG